VHHLAAETTAPNESWRSQLGPLPDTYDEWLAVDRLGEPTVPIGVATAATNEPVDPIVRSILRRWPETPRLVIHADTETDLVASSPVAVARAIDEFLDRLSATSP
jgi:hypothetical protein